MPSNRDFMMVISIYMLENGLHPKMRKYIRTVLERGKSQDELQQMTKEELWGLVEYFAKDLQVTMQQLGAL